MEVLRASGDGWTQCSCGSRHWGRFGAAGLLLFSDTAVLLQLRAAWSHQGGTWSIPGGARTATESALAAALREAHEEVGLHESDIAITGQWTDDHGPWAYTTVLARTTHRLALHAHNSESDAVRWIERDAVTGLDLHPGFAASWPRLRSALPQL